MIHITGDTHGEQARIAAIEAQAPARQYPAAVVRCLQPVREHTPFPPFFSKGRDFCFLRAKPLAILCRGCYTDLTPHG